jgi:ligand-binding sensor domain-containing protein/signal transduction histidine kinase
VLRFYTHLAFRKACHGSCSRGYNSKNECQAGEDQSWESGPVRIQDSIRNRSSEAAETCTDFATKWIRPGAPRRVDILGLRAFAMGLLVMGSIHSTLAAQSAAENEPQAAENLVFRSWRTEAGLPHNTVNGIVQTSDGYLWIGTRDGLARFDGVRFVAFGLREGLPSVEVQTLYQDSKGTLWIGTSGGGLSRLNADRIETLSFPQYLAGSGTVTSLAEDGAGRLWIGTRAGLTVSEHSRFATQGDLAKLSHSGVRTLLRDRTGVMWIATLSEGLYEFRQNRLDESPGPQGNEKILAYSLLEDSHSNLWASVGNGTLLCRHDGEWQVYGETNGLPYAYVTCLAEDHSGTVWAGSLDEGLYFFRGGHFSAIRQEQGLSANDVRVLCPDREGHLWVGTRTGGLNYLSRRKLVSVGAQQGLTNNYTRSVAETSDAVLWVGTTGGGLYRGGPDGFNCFAPQYSTVESVLATQDGSLWWGAARGLFCLRAGGLVDSYTSESWLGPAAVTALAEDGRGGLWIGTSEDRLVQYKNHTFVEVPDRLARGPITGLAPEPSGALWVGSMAGGLQRMGSDHQLIESVTNQLPSLAIRTLYLDATGVLWIGTAGGGLSCWDHGRATTFSPATGFTANTVVQIVEDDYGYLWLGTSRGVLRIRKSELTDVAAGRASLVHLRSFGVNEGMPAEECSSGFCPAGLKTRAGLVCISTVKGLVFFDPRNQATSPPPPHTILEEIVVNGKVEQPQAPPIDSRSSTARLDSQNAAPDRSLILPPGGRELEFHYTAISFDAPEKLRFRYQMEGLDHGWTDAGERRTAYYHGVAPGHYIFRVVASNSDGAWSPKPTTLAVTIHPYVWETTWFMALVAVATAALLVGVIRLMERGRYRRRLAALETRHAVERERLRIAQDMHDDLGSLLTQVSQLSDLGQSETGGPAAAKTQFERIGTQSRAAVRALDEIVWATNPKSDNLPRFAEYIGRFADELFENSSVRCWQEIPTNLPKVPLGTGVRHNVFLAVKEAFNNVLKHAGATEVWLRLSFRESEASVLVEDNGRGFEHASVGPGGNGLENMKMRLKSCGGTMELRSAPGKGTQIRFLFPLPKAA